MGLFYGLFVNHFGVILDGKQYKNQSAILHIYYRKNVIVTSPSVDLKLVLSYPEAKWSHFIKKNLLNLDCESLARGREGRAVKLD